MIYAPRWLLATVVGLSLAAGCDDAASVRPAAVRSPGEAPAASDTALSEPAAKPESAAPAGVLPPRDSAGVVEATFDDVKFDMEKTEKFERSMLTPRVNAMAGERIRIRGYMFPPSRKKGLKQFVLVRDNMECCFGPGAALFDCILVNMAPGKTAEFSIRPIAVEGEFHIEELPGPDDRPLAIYQMTGEEVQ